MSRSAVTLNGPALSPVRMITIGWRGATLALLVQAAILLIGGAQYIERIRSDGRDFQTSVNLRFDALDRRLSKLDGVPR